MKSIGSVRDYDILGKIPENFQNINLYLAKFYSLYIANKSILVILTLILSFVIGFLLIHSYIQTKCSSTPYRHDEDIKREKIYIILGILYSIILGFFIACSSSVLITNYRGADWETYIMERDTFQLIGTNIYGFIIISMSGIIYYYLGDKAKKLFLFIFICFCIFLLYKFIPNYVIKIQDKINDKMKYYNLEKAAVIYSYLGESAIWPPVEELPGNVLWDNSFGFKNYDDYTKWCINKYFDQVFFGYTFYHNYIYKNKIIGYQFKDNNYFNEQLNRRIKLFNLNIKESKYPFLIRFSDINKLDNNYLTLEDIERNEKTFGQDDIFLKAKGYVYFRDKNYNQALKFYKRYLNNNPNDYDALINIGKIYKEQHKFRAAENYYKKLIKLDYYNYLFNFLLMEAFYEEGNYTEALKINTKLINLEKGIDTYNYMISFYLNQAILYNAMNDKNKADEFISKAKEINGNGGEADKYKKVIDSNEKIKLIQLVRGSTE